MISSVAFLVPAKTIAQKRGGQGELWFENDYHEDMTVKVSAKGNYRWGEESAGFPRTSQYTGGSQFTVPAQDPMQWTLGATWANSTYNIHLSFDKYSVKIRRGDDLGPLVLSIKIDFRTTNMDTGDTADGLFDLVIRRNADGSFTWHIMQWDGRNDQGFPVANGTYLIILESERKHVSQKINLVK